MANAYLAGATLQEIAASYGRKREAVSKAIKRAGVPVRYKVLSAEQVRDAVARYEGGDSLATLGVHFNVSPDTINRALVAAGVTLRPRPGRRPQN